MHWTEGYVGKPYVLGEYECGDMVAEVVFKRLGKEIELPSEQVWRGTSPGKVIDLASDFAVKVSTPAECDAVLMKIEGRKREIGSHVGLHVLVGAERWVLHNIRGFGVLFHPEGHCARLGLTVTGYFTWRK